MQRCRIEKESDARAYGLNSLDYAIDEGLAYLDRFDRSEGFLDPSQSGLNQGNNSNLALDGKLNGQDWV